MIPFSLRYASASSSERAPNTFRYIATETNHEKRRTKGATFFQGSGGLISGRKQQSEHNFCWKGLVGRWYGGENRCRESKWCTYIYIYICFIDWVRKKNSVNINKSIHTSSSCLWMLALRFGRFLVLDKHHFFHMFVWCHSPPCHQKNLFRTTEGSLHEGSGSSSWLCTLLTSWFEFQARIHQTKG